MVLGPWKVIGSSGPAVVPAGQMRVLLASLLLSLGRSVPADVLGDHLWPDQAPVRVRPTVHTYVARLRRLLGRDIIETSRDGYLLTVDPSQIDLWQFRDLLGGAAAGVSVESELALLRDALRLWRGRPFAGVESTWLDREIIPRIDEEWFAAVERRIELELQIGRHGSVIAELWDLARRYPTRESLWLRLIEALHRSGRRGDALDAYRQVRSHLTEELGIEPGDALQSLHRQVLLDGAVAFDHAQAAPVLRCWTALQLPHDVARFTERPELARLGRLGRVIEQDPRRLTNIVVIEGPAGIGKTTLAVHWAHRVASAYPDIQLYVDLRGHGARGQLPPSAAVETLLRGLGVPSDVIPPGLDERSAMLRGTLSGRRALVLLDDVRDTNQVRPLLPGADSLVIVTSRRQLRDLSIRDGAHRITLSPLPPQAALALLATAYGSERTAAERDAAIRLVELCEGLPLALAIAAERAKAAGCLAEVVRVLPEEGTTHAHLFGDGSGDPHTDLWAALSGSYHTLGTDAADMFRALARHGRRDITPESAAALAGMQVRQARRALDQLADVHLAHRRLPHGYGMQDLVRRYASELAARAESAEPTDAAWAGTVTAV